MCEVSSIFFAILWHFHNWPACLQAIWLIMIKSAKSCHTAGYDRIDDAVKRQQSAYIFDTEIKMKKILKDP